MRGNTPIDEVSEELGTELPDEEWDTVGGLILNLLGHVPEEGEVYLSREEVEKAPGGIECAAYSWWPR